MRLDFRQLDGAAAYRWLAATVTPRPIAWISTRSAAGVDNLAPFSFFQVICDAPPTLIVSISPRPDGSEKDTLRNARDSGELVVQLVSQAQAEAMNASSATLGPEVSEFERCGIASVAFECRLVQAMPYPAEHPSRHLLFAEVLVAHIDDAVLADARHVDPRQLDLVGRLGGNQYTGTRDVFAMTRPA